MKTGKKMEFRSMDEFVNVTFSKKKKSKMVKNYRETKDNNIQNINKKIRTKT